MKTRKATSWAEFLAIIDEIRNRPSLGKRGRDSADDRPPPQILFRGQKDSRWKLRTTLERQSSRSFNIRTYDDLVMSCVPQLQAFTGHCSELLNGETADGVPGLADHLMADLPHYELLVYLRHHGFPSPLLDWTESPYIAAYFAFCDAEDSKRVAIFAYVERPTRHKKRGLNSPLITVHGPHVNTRNRSRSGGDFVVN